MNYTERNTADNIEVVDGLLSLFDEYNLRMVNLGGGPILLTPAGQEIFSQHLRMDCAQRIASILGYLIEERAKEPIIEPITVVDFSTITTEDYDKSYIAGQAVWRTPNFVGIEGVWMAELEDYEVVDECGKKVIINEVQLSSGAFVSTHRGYGVRKVLLTPESVLSPKLPQTL